MKQVELKESIFQVQKLANVVGIGNSAAFQVVIDPGKNVGLMGKVVNPADINSHNDPVFSESARGLGTWLKRSLTALGL